jgi:hypothetical protein
MDELQHNCKRDLANLRLEMVKEKGEQNCIKESLNNQIEDLRLKLDLATQNVETHRKMLEEKDRELTKNMNSLNEENWSKITELTNEK